MNIQSRAMAAFALGLLMFLRREPVKAALLGLTAIVFTSMLATAFSWSSMVRVYPDRIKLIQGRFPLSPERTSAGLVGATAVETYCYIKSGRRKRSVAHIAYVVHLSEIGPVDLGTASMNPERQSDSRLGLLQSLDNSGLKSVPGMGDGAQAVECLRLLRSQLGAEQFTVARRLMRIDDQTYLRRYAEPHESWNGTADR